MKSVNYENAHSVIFSISILYHLSYVQIFSSALCSQNALNLPFPSDWGATEIKNDSMDLYSNRKKSIHK
jgi:hypothetical protein